MRIGVDKNLLEKEKWVRDRTVFILLFFFEESRFTELSKTGGCELALRNFNNPSKVRFIRLHSMVD